MTELQRRRELATLTKPELIDRIITIERGIKDLRARIEHAYGEEP